MESAKVVAVVARMVRDVGVAEELAQDTLVSALETWSADALPDNPAAWLMTAAKRRAIDWIRRGRMIDGKLDELARELAIEGEGYDAALDAAFDEDIDDDLLRLIFVACHPVLSTEARVALTLRLLGGLTTDEIARAFLVPEPTVAQRIVRAKRALTAAQVPFEVPGADARAERLASVLEVLYLIFNEGYAATSGDDWMRPALCQEATRLGRILAALMPDDPEVHGLVALMELQASRFAARVDTAGRPILLADQDRARWDRLLIGRGFASLDRALAAGAPGPYALQAAIAACHARAPTVGATDWRRIVDLYDALLAATGSPVVALNRAVAVGMADGPAPALALVDALADDGRLAGYHLVDAVRGDLLARIGRHADAAEAFSRASDGARNRRERDHLSDRAARSAALAEGRSPP